MRRRFRLRISGIELPFGRSQCLRHVLLLIWLANVIGCAVNPVTGVREISLLSTGNEIAMGENDYGPMQQLGGGLYEVDDRVARYVEAVGQRVAAHSDRALPYEFVVVNDSTPNAWALPGGKIGIHRGLLVELDNGAELAAILAHEIVHAAAKHSANQIQRELLMGLFGLGVEYAVNDSEHAREIVAATQLGRFLASRKFDRDEEREADYYGIKYMHSAGYDTSAAVSLQEKFVEIDEERRIGLIAGFFATHPPSDERVANNRAALLAYPPGGDLAEASFQAHMRTLFADREAYDLADRARENMHISTSNALRFIDQAIDLQPQESLFHGIRGDILASQGKHQDAVMSYAVAINRNADYFAYYLGRGLSFDALGLQVRARDDLLRSNRLFQTPIASYRLGGYALASGDRSEAKRQFEFASQAEGELGQAALSAFLQLDVEDKPWKYLDVEPLFEDGQVAVEVTNSSGYALREIVVEVRAEINGEDISRRLRIDQLDTGYYDVVYSSIQYRSDDDVRVRTRVLSAAVGE